VAPCRIHIRISIGCHVGITKGKELELYEGEVLSSGMKSIPSFINIR